MSEEIEVYIARQEMELFKPATLVSHAYLDLLFERFNGSHAEMFKALRKAKEHRVSA